MPDETPTTNPSGLAPESLTGWGRYPAIEGHTARGEDLEALSRSAVLSRGLGRAYGDSALPPRDAAGPVVVTPLADRILAFDERTGVLRAEAGLSLATLRELLLPRGWFTPVSPGTRHVTLGGMVAADIHGKNHHVAGCFGRHVRALKIRTGDGEVREIGRDREPELFFATLGGMGLTGHVLEVEVTLERIETPWIYEESERRPNLEAVIETLAEASASWPMTVAWIDTSARGAAMGRGIVMRGRWATKDEAPARPPRKNPSVRVPFDFPSGLVNPVTIKLLNALYYRKHSRRKVAHVVHPETYFWQLDLLDEWNRGFGRRGFTQFQCVLPSSAALYRELLELFQRMGGCSFVTVFKDCGEAGEGMLSFPQRGTSLAVDIPMRKDGATQALVSAMIDVVIANGGRVYLAKDAVATAAQFRRMYPRWEEWMQVRRKYDPHGRLRSAQGVRLGLCE
ncbi:FAD-binding oxidoreductase [Paraliomyxa miuraensis]|uniref:FAD-binding oxidoreductase n=1 Tax=Paraliomyxa miuraensis TaxID=376150 RepID=UPI00224F510A|nr:FAD-binding oxidoreductase [Paraliomyxa miuraensis]MCX4247449.1 FAD-binding oxidoreductase [Paraliomyxa miuraensis]